MLVSCCIHLMEESSMLLTTLYPVFITGRVIIGLGLASFLMTSLIVVQEITHPRSRGAVAQSWVSFVLPPIFQVRTFQVTNHHSQNSYYILGLVIASWVVFGTSFLTSSWSWRIPYILQLPLALYVLIGVQFVPETPRFLLAKGREQEALAFLVEYHGNGDPTDQLVLFEFEEMRQTIRMEQEAKAERWSRIVRNPGSRYRLGLAVLMTFLTNVSIR
jgi:MFS transporter, SP family, sugar:H+ symporter